MFVWQQTTPSNSPWLLLKKIRGDEGGEIIYENTIMDVLPFIPYNTSLKDYAKHHRFQPNLTKAEALFWNIVLKYDKTGYRFLRQKIINSFILDFYCSKLRLGIEIDGAYHQRQKEYDAHRTEVLSKCGVKIIRYTNDDIQYRLNSVMKDLKEEIQIREKEVF